MRCSSRSTMPLRLSGRLRRPSRRSSSVAWTLQCRFGWACIPAPRRSTQATTSGLMSTAWPGSVRRAWTPGAGFGGDPSLDGGSIRTRRSGQHRLKDFDEPQHVYQLRDRGVSRSVPAPRRSEAGCAIANEATSIVGRQDEISEVARLVESSQVVTLPARAGRGSRSWRRGSRGRSPACQWQRCIRALGRAQ